MEMLLLFGVLVFVFMPDESFADALSEARFPFEVAGDFIVPLLAVVLGAVVTIFAGLEDGEGDAGRVVGLGIE